MLYILIYINILCRAIKFVHLKDQVVIVVMVHCIVKEGQQDSSKAFYP